MEMLGDAVVGKTRLDAYSHGEFSPVPITEKQMKLANTSHKDDISYELEISRA